MSPKLKQVQPLDDYMLKLFFEDGVERFFDVKPYLDKGFFKELKDVSLFNSVKLQMGTVQWVNGQDFCLDTLYLDSKSKVGVCL